MMTNLRPSQLQVGDIIGFSGYHLSSAFINLVTYGIPFWSLSHVGIIGEYDGQLLLFESDAAESDPCVIQGKPFSGTQAKHLDTKLRNYSGRAWHYPLYRSLYEDERSRLNHFLLGHIGIPYDKIGAFRAGGIGWSWVESQLRPADLSSLFCSEYCAAAHAHTGLLRTSHVSRWSPNYLVRHERRRGMLMKPRRLQCGK